ncbi:hypothetical protein [Sorangium sp. So ce854]|uniref:hypothetical protein n=1 Tax=Sorangium sp. So ce854 TaxID=3133322 RepID=UPI003F60A219
MESWKAQRAMVLAPSSKFGSIVTTRTAVTTRTVVREKTLLPRAAFRDKALPDRFRASVHKEVLRDWLDEEHERHFTHSLIAPMREARPVWGIPVDPQHEVTRRDSYDTIAHAIRQASDSPEPHDAIAQIDSIWERVEDVSAVAEARMRLLLKKVAPPALSSQPAWLRDGIEELRRDLGGTGPQYNSAIESASRLICSVLEVAGSTTAQAVLSASLFGGVEVEWRTARDLMWIVWPPRLNWPGVHVRVYSRPGDGAKLIANTFHQAFGVINYSLKHLAG